MQHSILTHGRAIGVKSSVALSYVPVIYSQLDNDGKEMLTDLLQAMREGGYEDGFEDGRQSQRVASALEGGRR